ncbi:DUF4097 family beta strand repeat-containing protein [Jeotgalibacillus soli]|uniref:DUF4097 domain-containing protein n=1 Tax=Jeotgalibacillus soli TaxID=889306 RepID=A0A0C2S2K4_9BACL|nr:DUF4097 family beta strand repeat-containing protein [Jeotgalibacillus soli]KIL48249.1 hypothetical protein KP78_16960 [Jeotgalibacillus soli]
MTVEIPAESYSSIEVKTSSADQETTDLKADRLTFVSTSGDITLDGITAADSVEMKLSSGDGSLSEVHTKNLTVDASSGDIVLFDSELPIITLSTSSGDIELNHVNGKATLESSSGRIDILQENLDNEYIISSSSGNVDLQLDNRPKALSVDFQSSSGEGEVNISNLNVETMTDHHVLASIGNEIPLIDVRTSSGGFDLGIMNE